MRSIRTLALLLLLLPALAGCDKDMVTTCEEFKPALAAEDAEKVKSIINRYMLGLPSMANTSENLELLAQAITKECQIEANVVCFGCIKTLPEQSEISLRFFHQGQTIERAVDISYTPDNKMKFVNVHGF